MRKFSFLQARRCGDLVVPDIPATRAVVLCEWHMEDFVLKRGPVPSTTTPVSLRLVRDGVLLYLSNRRSVF